MNLRIAIGGAFAALLLSSSAGAQLFRSYIASDGSDANPCTLPQPCRLLPAALAAVADGGEIWMLDSANYNTGPVTIGKSVAILAVPGAVASVLSQQPHCGFRLFRLTHSDGAAIAGPGQPAAAE